MTVPVLSDSSVIATLWYVPPHTPGSGRAVYSASAIIGGSRPRIYRRRALRSRPWRRNRNCVSDAARLCCGNANLKLRANCRYHEQHFPTDRWIEA